MPIVYEQYTIRDSVIQDSGKHDPRHPQTNRDWALGYAKELGCAVFAMPRGSKVPFRGSHGAGDASSDPRRVARMFEADPNANIGLVPSKSDLLALDFDMDKGGDLVWR